MDLLPSHHRLGWILTLLIAWAVAAYVIAPQIWKLVFRKNPGLAAGPHLTHTVDGHDGDPVNIGLVGSREDVVRGMIAAGWFPADPITWDSSMKIVVDSVVGKPDDKAPVSDLFLFGRKEDLAFELPVGNSPRQRHHVRFWLWDKKYDGRDAWFGSASFDERVGLSHTTGQVTHHIGPNVDAERDLIMAGLKKAGWAQEEFFVDGYQPALEGHNGGGDLWRTDGRLGAVELRPPASP